MKNKQKKRDSQAIATCTSESQSSVTEEQRAAALPPKTERSKVRELSKEEVLKEYRHVSFPLGDPEGERQAAKKMYLNRAGANVFRSQTDWLLNDSTGVVADAFMMSVMKSINARDAVEEMLCVQMAWTHARLAKLSSIAGIQRNVEHLRIINEACDRAANTFRRQMIALAEYRRPPKQETFALIKHANLANQQVIQNGGSEKNENENSSNEQGLAGVMPAQIPSFAVGPGIPTSIGGQNEAVAVEYRAEDTRRQDAVAEKCPEAW